MGVFVLPKEVVVFVILGGGGCVCITGKGECVCVGAMRGVTVSTCAFLACHQ